MAAGTCSLCFRHKELVRPIPQAEVTTCKACAYKVEQVVGFLKYYGVELVYQPKLSPPKPPQSKSRPKKTKTRELYYPNPKNA